VRSMERLVEASERGSEVTGLATGYTDLDRLTGGLRPSNLVVVAARPSMGKTALALGMAEHAALNDNLSVAIFSLEMSGEELVQRMLSSTAMVDAGRMRTGRLGQEDWPRVSHAADRLAAARIYIDDSEGMSVAELRTKARRLKSRDGLDLMIVDYIQLMEGNRGRRDENRVQEISAISRSLKMLARDLEVPLVCVSQLNRAPDARNDKRPMLSDLRESGAIEQDADLVLMIYRDDYYNPEDSEEKGIAEVNVAKNRNGPVNRVKLAFMGNYAKFGNLARDE
jgi:replicative DNA helicase